MSYTVMLVSVTLVNHHAVIEYQQSIQTRHTSYNLRPCAGRVLGTFEMLLLLLLVSLLVPLLLLQLLLLLLTLMRLLLLLTLLKPCC
jgi:hypothetical protein